MATYTVELRMLVNSPYYEIFDFDYPFYCSDIQTKKEFEELFINRFYFHEIGAETVDRWKHMLKTRLYLKMPYYSQLYLTEWERTGKDMMQSKDLTETTIHTLTSNDKTNGTMNSTSSASASDSSSGSVEDTSTGSVEGENKTDESYIADGVGIVNLDEDNKTGTTSSTSTSSSTSSSTISSSTEGESESNASSQSTNSNTNELKLEEKTTFSSSGVIGIQTPAYAITEWRKVIINLNEMLLNEFEDLFMQIY